MPADTINPPRNKPDNARLIVLSVFIFSTPLVVSGAATNSALQHPAKTSAYCKALMFDMLYQVNTEGF